jgi:predicted outer membrane repeat protein
MTHARVFAAALACALPMVFGSACASTLTVTSLGDTASTPGDGTLRGEILASNAGDTIVFAPSLNGPINLTDTLPIEHSLTIQGPGAGIIALDGGASFEVLVIESGTLTLSGVTIANGGGTAQGGGISVDSNTALIVSDTTFNGNSADMRGGAIFVSGLASLTVDSSTFTGNLAGNIGGAIHNGGTAMVTRSTFIDNSASIGGGGAISTNGQMTAVDDTFVGNATSSDGGAISDLASITVINSTFSTNMAARGGAISVTDKSLTLYNSVFAGNGGTSSGGALFLQTPITAGNNVFFGNLGDGTEDDQAGYGSSGFVLAAANPLAPLANNGGPTQTQLPGGAAVCAGSAALLPVGLRTDQRGLPRISGSCVDAGSVQVTQAAVPALTPGWLVGLGFVLAMLGIRRLRQPAP